MGFLEEAGKFVEKSGKKIVKLADETKDNANIAIEKGKIKRQITAEKANIEKDLAEIGKIFYRQNMQNPPEEYSAAFRSINVSEKNISALNLKLTNLDKETTCTGCGSKVKKEQKFCQVCGTRTTEIEVMDDINNEEDILY